MNNAKYVIIEKDGFPVPIIFSAIMNHSDVGLYFGRPISAGFVAFGVDDIGNVDCKTYGRSVTLNLDSRPEDNEIVKKHLLHRDY